MLIALASLLAVLVVAQFVLPALAERRIRDRLDDYGKVESLEISAFPAVQLLWQRADNVKVRMTTYRSGQAKMADFLSDTRKTNDLDVRVGTVSSGALTIHDARLSKRGEELAGEARVTREDIRRALPPGVEVMPVGADANGIIFQGQAGLFGVNASLRARATVDNGAIRLIPEVPFGGLVSFNVFADDRVEVTEVGGAPRADGFTLTARARLR